MGQELDNMNTAFSLLELLVTMTIVIILILMGMRFYNTQKQSSYMSWAKAEMIDISKIMKAAKGYDGYYHQFIYAMGYQPKGKIYASVGTAASPTSICCSQYPDPGTTPCKKNGQSGYLYYNCKSGIPHTATDNIKICDFSNACETVDLVPLATSRFSTCRPSLASWCDCEEFTVGAITFLGKELSINQMGELCEEN